MFSAPKKYPAIEENIMLNDNRILVSCIKLTKKDKKLKEIVLDCSIWVFIIYEKLPEIEILKLSKNYCNLNVMGILNGTLTALPLCLPGTILGNLPIILSASPSRFLSGPLDLTFIILPSVDITKLT